jgi:hypothetical protein
MSNPYESPFEDRPAAQAIVLGQFQGKVLPTCAIYATMTAAIASLTVAALTVLEGPKELSAIMVVSVWVIVASIAIAAPWAMLYKIKVTTQGIKGINSYCMPCTIKWDDVIVVKKTALWGLIKYLRIIGKGGVKIWGPMYMKDENVCYTLMASHLLPDQIRE